MAYTLTILFAISFFWRDACTNALHERNTQYTTCSAYVSLGFGAQSTPVLRLGTAGTIRYWRERSGTAGH